MQSYRNILVGINYTTASRHALLKANRIASEEGAKLTACHVVPLGEITEFVDFYMIEHKIMTDAALSSLEGFVDETLGDDHGVTCLIREGIPHHELVARANEDGYDLLVIGDDDYAADSRKAGQFAIKCLRFAKMPVLLMNRPETSPDGPIAACLDLSGSTDPVLENAARLCAISSPELHLVHVARPPWLHPFKIRYRKEVFEDKGLKEQFREVLDGQLEVIEEKATKLTSSPIKICKFESEDPTHTLLDRLDSNDYNLVIIGRAGKGFKGLVTDFMGGTAETLIRHLGSPLLIVPITE
jgi:nucleotide-binding universal stress UspA family protein